MRFRPGFPPVVEVATTTPSTATAAATRVLASENAVRRVASVVAPSALSSALVAAMANFTSGFARARLRSSRAINESLDPHEQLDCLVVTAEAWTVDNDLITPTFKVKRNRIEDLFAKNYDHWVSLRKTVIWHKAG